MCKTTDIERRAELKAAFLEALNGTMGLVMAACDKVGVHRNTILSWRKADPEFDAAVTDVQERQVDYVENNLLRLIQDGDTSATIFYLKTKGKKRGYSEKATPEPEPTVASDVAREFSAAANARMEAVKEQITNLLKDEGKYTAELTMQITLTARLMTRTQDLFEEMSSPGYQQVLVEYSREGNRRESVNPKEKLYMDYVRETQRALKALGMNTDSKERKSDGDDFGDFMRSMVEPTGDPSGKE